MKRHTRRVSSVAALTAAALAATLGPLAAPATAQERGAAATPDAEHFVVTADVDIRSGAADSYYPFGRLEAGDVVEVIGEKNEWARVVTVGPAFEGFFAYLRYPQSETGRFKLDPDGRRGRTQGATRVLAPNMNTGYDPNDSWKRILLLEGDRVVDVLETRDDGRLVVHQIALPPDAEGWVNTRFLEKATDAQVAAWKAAVARGPKTPGGAKKGPAGAVLARDEPVVPGVRPPTGGTGAAGAAPTSGPPAEPELEGAIDTDALDTAAHDVPAAIDDPTLRDAIDAAIEPRAPEDAPGDAAAGRPGQAPTREETFTMEEPRGALDGGAAPALEPEKGLAGAPAPKPAPRTPKERLEDLEAAYARLREEPIATAEVVPLRGLYLGLADASVDDDAVFRYAQARAEQLAIWADLQQRRAELSRLRKRLELTAEESRAVRLALEAKGVYTAVGRLAASTIYDGGRLPRLLRIQEIASGRTIAYVRPDAAFDYNPMLGQLIGVVGTMQKSEELGVTLVEPKRIDLLSEQAG